MSLDLEAKANPYAPPQTNVQALPDARLWKIEGDDLWVRNGAAFEDVDLGAGKICQASAKRRQAQLRGTWETAVMIVLGLIIVAATIATQFIKDKLGMAFSPWWLFVPLALSIPYWPAKMLGAQVSYASAGGEPHERWRKIISYVGVGLFVLGLILGFVFYQTSAMPLLKVMFLCLVAGVLVIAVSAIWREWKRRRVRYAEIDGKWFRLKDISPVVIEHLRKAEQKMHQAAHDPNLWVYSVDLTRYPMGEWCRVLKWNPVACLNIFLRKFVLRAPLIMKGSIKRSPTMVSPEVISERFRGEVEEFRQRLEPKGWSLEGWQRVRVQGFDAWTEEATFLHSDGRSSLSLVITDGVPFKRRLAIVLLSWTKDGRILRTITQPEFAGFISAVEVVRVKGGTKEAMKLHAKRITDEKCIRLQGINEWAHRAHEIHLRSHAYMYERGIYGPLEG